MEWGEGYAFPIDDAQLEVNVDGAAVQSAVTNGTVGPLAVPITSTSTSRVRVVELPPSVNTSDPNIYVAIEQTGAFQTSSTTTFGPTAMEDFPTDLSWVPLSSVYDQSLLIDNNLLVISGTESNQFDGYFLLYLCTTATPNPPVSGSASLLILLLVGGSMSGGWYVTSHKKGSVAYRVIRVGVFALIVIVFLVGCDPADPTATPEASGTPAPTGTSEPIPQPTSCPEAPGIPTVTPAPPTATDTAPPLKMQIKMVLRSSR